MIVSTFYVYDSLCLQFMLMTFVTHYDNTFYSYDDSLCVFMPNFLFIIIHFMFTTSYFDTIILCLA
jgi:hypothetical protein